MPEGRARANAQTQQVFGQARTCGITARGLLQLVELAGTKKDAQDAHAMAEAKPPPSEVVPLLLAALLCDAAIADPVSAKANLIGVFDNLHTNSFPLSRPVYVFVKLTEAEGFYEVWIRCASVQNGRVLAEGKAEMTARNRLESFGLIFPFPPIDFPEEGRYEFQVWANGNFLGSATMNAVLR